MERALETLAEGLKSAQLSQRPRGRDDLPHVERQSALVRRSKQRLSTEARDFIESLRQQATLLGLIPRTRASRERSAR